MVFLTPNKKYMKTILFIEDESALQKALGDVLRHDEFQMLSALDGEIGLRLAQEKLPDLILLDITLPRMNGFDVLARLKEDETTKQIPVIVLTNLEGMKDVDRAIELGATTYLVKANYKLEDIISKIKEVCKLNHNS